MKNFYVYAGLIGLLLFMTNCIRSVEKDFGVGYEIIKEEAHPSLAKGIASIYGYVTDEKRNPIAGALVFTDTHTRTFSDKTGKFELRFPVGNYQVHVQYEGYKEITTASMYFKNGFQTELEVHLAFDSTIVAQPPPPVANPNTQNARLHTDTTRAHEVVFRNHTYHIFRAYPKKDKIAFYWTDEKDNLLGSIGRLLRWKAAQKTPLMFVTNGGMYEKNGSPKGLYIESGDVYVPIDTSAGEGNFYMKPNGIFLLGGKGASVIETSEYFQIRDSVAFATQSGPLLVHRGQLHPNFQEKSTNLYIRSGVGIVSADEVVFAISNEPVNFYDFALLFKEYLGCANALYLDGAISQMYAPALQRYDSTGTFGCMIGVHAP